MIKKEKCTIQNEICDLKHKGIDDKIEKITYMIQNDIKDIKQTMGEIKEHIVESSNRITKLEDETAIIRWLSKNPKTFIFLLATLISVLMSEGYSAIVKLIANVAK